MESSRISNLIQYIKTIRSTSVQPNIVVVLNREKPLVIQLDILVFNIFKC